MFKTCPTCKKEFEKKLCESKKSWSSRRVFCSKICQYPPKESIVCRECRVIFLVRFYRKHIAQFCSRKCAHQNRNYGLTPANEKVRKSAAYRAWRTLVFERDNYTCRDCGTQNGHGKTVYLHADHIQPFALYPSLRFDINNGRTLCVACHKKTSTYGRQSIYRQLTKKQ